MSSDKYKFFSGTISVQKPRSEASWATLVQYNETYVGWATDEDAARGAWVKDVLDRFPGGTIIFVGVYDSTDVVRNNPNGLDK